MGRYGQSVSGCQNPGHSRHVHQWDGDQYTTKTDTWSGHVNKLGHETLPPASGQAGMNATEDKTLQMIDLDSKQHFFSVNSNICNKHQQIFHAGIPGQH